MSTTSTLFGRWMLPAFGEREPRKVGLLRTVAKQLTTTAGVEELSHRHMAAISGLLTPMLSQCLGSSVRIRAVDHRPSECRSTFSIHEIDVLLESGMLLRMMLKRSGPPGLLPNASLTKPLFLHDPLRELELHQHIFPERPSLGTPILFSSVVEPAQERYWLLLERVAGAELERVANIEGWKEAARWLARMHRELAPVIADDAGPGIRRLLRIDRDHLRMWITRALVMVRVGDPALSPALSQKVEWLARIYDGVIDRLAAMPRTFIHGEFYPSNILLNRESHPTRVCTLDWEMAGIGPPLLDLAALLAAEPEAERRRKIAFAYLAGTPDGTWQTDREFFSDLACCRLHLAVQWLGFSPDRPAHPKEAHQWIGAAVRLAEEAGF